MKQNVGGVDRLLRAILGVGLLSLLLLLEGNGRWFGLIGLVPLATAVLGYCPLYSVFGMSTSTHKGPQHA
jgi:hypothetical protein